MAKKLYTEATVRELPAGSELVLGRDALATPSALELAFARGIRVRYADGASAPGAGAAAADPWRRAFAEDGTYVVEVKGGKPQVYRLTGAGPVALKVEGN